MTDIEHARRHIHLLYILTIGNSVLLVLMLASLVQRLP